MERNQWFGPNGTVRVKSNSLKWAALLNLFVGLAQLVLAIIIIVINNNELRSVTMTSLSENTVNVEFKCLLGASVKATGPCNYVYALASISIFWTFWMALLQCLTINCCGMGPFWELFTAILGSVWWTVGAVQVGRYKDQADNRNFPGRGDRENVFRLCWACAALFYLHLLLSTFLIAKVHNIMGQLKQGQGPNLKPVQMGTVPQQPGPYNMQQAPEGYPPQGPANYPPQGNMPGGPQTGFPHTHQTHTYSTAPNSASMPTSNPTTTNTGAYSAV